MKEQAFTVRSEQRLDRLITECGISEPFDPNSGLEHPQVHTVKALWDTGATISSITKDVVDKLKIQPYSIGEVYHAQGKSDTNMYMVNIFLPNRVAVSAVKVLEGVLHGCDMLIGMDVISHGDFSITHKNGGTIFSFQIPPTHDYDFVKQLSYNQLQKPASKHNKRKKRK